jgi:hypothetical protein
MNLTWIERISLGVFILICGAILTLSVVWPS